MALIQRLARQQVQRVAQVRRTPEPDQPELPIPAVPAEGPVAGAVRPFMPAVPGDMLKGVIDAKDKSPQASRIGHAGYTHISTLANGVCSRHYAINAIHDKKDWESVTGGHRLMWKYGRAAEAHIRDQITSTDRLRFQIFGEWRCVCGQTKHVGTKPKDKRCGTCQRPVSHFHETAMFDHRNRIVGNCDLPIILGRYFMPYEFKSMTAQEWDKLAAPKPEHIAQAIGYRHLFQEQGFLVHDYVGVLYAKKEFKFGSPYKEYHVDATQRPYQRMLDRMLTQAQEIRDAIATGDLPPRQTVCSSPDAAKSKACPRCQLCWNLPA